MTEAKSRWNPTEIIPCRIKTSIFKFELDGDDFKALEIKIYSLYILLNHIDKRSHCPIFWVSTNIYFSSNKWVRSKMTENCLFWMLLKKYGKWCKEVPNWIPVICNKRLKTQVKIGTVVLYKRAIQMLLSFHSFPQNIQPGKDF